MSNCEALTAVSEVEAKENIDRHTPLCPGRIPSAPERSVLTDTVAVWMDLINLMALPLINNRSGVRRQR